MTTCSRTFRGLTASVSAFTVSAMLVATVSAMLVATVARAQGGGPPVGARAGTGAPTKPPAPAPTLLKPAPVVPGAIAKIVGTVFDSLSMKPLRSATVQLVSGEDPSKVRSVSSNDRGDFTIDSVRAGAYLLGFFHPRLDSLSIESPLSRVDVRTDGEVYVTLALPSAKSIIARICGAEVVKDGLGVFVGSVRSARGEALSAPARIRASWTEISFGPRGIDRRSPSHFATTSASGAFAICGVPTDGTFMTRAFVPGDSSGFVEMEASKNGFLHRDIYIGAATKTENSALRGAGKLRGVVRSSTGQPISNAKLVLWGSGLEATTNSNGQFSMQTLPSGTYTLESRAIGYMPMRSAVDVLESNESVAELAMSVFVPMVDTLKIKGTRNAVSDPLQGFDQRKKSGFGYFFDSDALNRRNASFMSDVLRGTPGLTVTPGQLSGDKVTMRGSAGPGTCVPAIYINGALAYVDDGNLDAIVNTQDVVAMEVYSRTGSMPIQFQQANGCGSIVIWTGRRKPTNPNP